jgi:hypothetical protein
MCGAEGSEGAASIVVRLGQKNSGRARANHRFEIPYDRFETTTQNAFLRVLRASVVRLDFEKE